MGILVHMHGMENGECSLGKNVLSELRTLNEVREVGGGGKNSPPGQIAPFPADPSKASVCGRFGTMSPCFPPIA